MPMRQRGRFDIAEAGDGAQMHAATIDIRVGRLRRKGKAEPGRAAHHSDRSQRTFAHVEAAASAAMREAGTHVFEGGRTGAESRATGGRSMTRPLRSLAGRDRQREELRNDTDPARIGPPPTRSWRMMVLSRFLCGAERKELAMQADMATWNFMRGEADSSPRHPLALDTLHALQSWRAGHAGRRFKVSRGSPFHSTEQLHARLTHHVHDDDADADLSLWCKHHQVHGSAPTGESSDEGRPRRAAQADPLATGPQPTRLPASLQRLADPAAARVDAS